MTHSAPPHHVLVVEDNADAREALRALLEDEGYRVDLAEDGEQGLALALGTQPAVALVDIGLPRLDGYGFARRLRETPAGQAIRLVAVTGYGQATDRRRALEAGFDAFLVKPVEPAELLRVVATPGATGD